MNDAQRLAQRATMILVARDLHGADVGEHADGEYTRGQAELITQVTVLAHEDADNIKEDVIAAILR